MCPLTVPKWGQALVAESRLELRLSVALRDHQARAVLRSSQWGWWEQVGGGEWTLSCSEH